LVRFGLGRSALALLGDERVGDLVLDEASARDLGVVPPVEPDRLDVHEQPAPLRVFEGGSEHHRVVAVGPVDRNAKGDAVCVDEDGPLPPELSPIGRVLPRSLPTSWGFVERAVERDVGEIEADDLVVARECFSSDEL